MAKRREDGQIRIFPLCLPVDISSATGCCQNCWYHAKTQSQDSRLAFPAIQLCASAPLREAKAGIDEPPPAAIRNVGARDAAALPASCARGLPSCGSALTVSGDCYPRHTTSPRLSTPANQEDHREIPERENSVADRNREFPGARTKIADWSRTLGSAML